MNELFAINEEGTKTMIDKVCQKNGVLIEKTILTSEQYKDLVRVTNGRFTEEYFAYLKEKYGKKWVLNNVFRSNIEEMSEFEKIANGDDDFEDDIEVECGDQDGFSMSLGESYKFAHEGLSHIFLMYAKGIIQKLTPEQFSLLYLELYGRTLSLEICTRLVEEINQEKTRQINAIFTEQTGDSTLVKNALAYLQSRAKKENWSQERLMKETSALKLAAKDIENEVGVILGRSWIEKDQGSKDSALKKTFNFLLKKMDKVITGSVRDIADIESISTKKIKLDKQARIFHPFVIFCTLAWVIKYPSNQVIGITCG